MIGTAIVLVATYLYGTAEGDSPGQLLPPPISISDYEKSDEPSCFDIEGVVTAGKSPLRSNALSTSRPTTPTAECRSLRPKSAEKMGSKRAL
jgi:UDP-sugar transporter A1/2/3